MIVFRRLISNVVFMIFFIFLLNLLYWRTGCNNGDLFSVSITYNMYIIWIPFRNNYALLDYFIVTKSFLLDVILLWHFKITFIINDRWFSFWSLYVIEMSIANKSMQRMCLLIISRLLWIGVIMILLICFIFQQTIN